MPSDRPPRGEDPSAFARELVAEAAAVYGRARAAVIAGVRPVGDAPSAATAQQTLRATVVAYARALRAAGAAPERVVIEVKSTVDAALKLNELDRRACVGSAVRWAIKAYYDA
jgi:hypothetical protein